MIEKKMKKLSAIFILVAIFSLTGCMVGPDYQKPVIDTPDRFRFSDAEAEAVVNLKWWELFNDPVLDSLVEIAMKDNKDVRIAASRIDEARASLGFTRADLYPAFDIEAGAVRGNFAGGRLSEFTDNNFFISPVMNWEIDFWGKLRRATESARADLMATQYSMRTIQISLISEVVSTYFMLLDFHQRLEISRQTLESRLESLDIIEKRFSHGIIPEIDVNQSQIQKEEAAAAIPVFERLIAKAENALSILLGKFPGEIKKGVDLYHQTIPPDIPVGLPSTLLERRPDIIRAEYDLRAQTEQIGVAEALRLPAISLTGSAGYASTELASVTTDGFGWSIGANVFGPIYHFNKNKLRVEIQEERTKQAMYQYENTILFAFRDVSDSLTDIQTYKKQISSVEKKLAAAKNADRLAKLRYDKGVSSYLEVLETERSLFSVGLELSDLTQQYYNSYVRLYKSLGGGWLSEEEMEQAKVEDEARQKEKELQEQESNKSNSSE
jgi:multidrug efflux system outer membrane protein